MKHVTTIEAGGKFKFDVAIICCENGEKIPRTKSKATPDMIALVGRPCGKVRASSDDNRCFSLELR